VAPEPTALQEATAVAAGGHERNLKAGSAEMKRGAFADGMKREQVLKAGGATIRSQVTSSRSNKGSSSFSQSKQGSSSRDRSQDAIDPKPYIKLLQVASPSSPAPLFLFIL
jgi:hypothetical protein